MFAFCFPLILKISSLLEWWILGFFLSSFIVPCVHCAPNFLLFFSSMRIANNLCKRFFSAFFVVIIRLLRFYSIMSWEKVFFFPIKIDFVFFVFVSPSLLSYHFQGDSEWPARNSFNFTAFSICRRNAFVAIKIVNKKRKPHWREIISYACEKSHIRFWGNTTKDENRWKKNLIGILRYWKHTKTRSTRCKQALQRNQWMNEWMNWFLNSRTVSLSHIEFKCIPDVVERAIHRRKTRKRKRKEREKRRIKSK